MGRFTFYKQLGAMDCGPACLRMIAKFYGRNYPHSQLCNLSGVDKNGVSLLGISQAAEAIGLRTLAVTTSLDKIKKEDLLPCIVHWRQNHFVIVYRIKKDKIFVADPAKSLLTYSTDEFTRYWNNGGAGGVALLLEPSPGFYEQ